MIVATIYLQPGEVFFGKGPGRVRTLLGSCVAITLFHPVRSLGAMCHFVLPRRACRTDTLDARYGDEALALLAESIRASDTRPEDYRAWVHGGGNMFPHLGKGTGHHVGQQNVAMAFQLVEKYGFQLVDSDVGDNVYRHVTLELPGGRVWVENNMISGAAKYA